MTIGEKIQEARKKAGISQLELSSKMNTKSAAISQWESNKRIPKTENLLKIADALEIGLGELLMLSPEVDREQISKASTAVRGASERLDCLKQENAPGKEIEEAERVFTVTVDVLSGIILSARLEHERDLAERRLQLAESSLSTQKVILPAPAAAAHDEPVEWEGMQEMLRSLICQTVHSPEDGECLAKLISAYKKLNSEGRTELIKRAEEMAYVPAYDK